MPGPPLHARSGATVITSARKATYRECRAPYDQRSLRRRSRTGGARRRQPRHAAFPHGLGRGAGAGFRSRHLAGPSPWRWPPLCRLGGCEHGIRGGGSARPRLRLSGPSGNSILSRRRFYLEALARAPIPSRRVFPTQTSRLRHRFRPAAGAWRFRCDSRGQQPVLGEGATALPLPLRGPVDRLSCRIAGCPAFRKETAPRSELLPIRGGGCCRTAAEGAGELTGEGPSG
ncbi:hypothetical protein ABIE78_004354 [Sinorhizobium fredii]